MICLTADAGARCHVSALAQPMSAQQCIEARPVVRAIAIREAQARGANLRAVTTACRAKKSDT